MDEDWGNETFTFDGLQAQKVQPTKHPQHMRSRNRTQEQTVNLCVSIPPFEQIFTNSAIAQLKIDAVVKALILEEKAAIAAGTLAAALYKLEDTSQTPRDQPLTPHRRGKGKHPPKGRQPRQREAGWIDGRRKVWTTAIDHHNRQNILDAVRYAHGICRDLNCRIDVHPALLDAYPDDLNAWLRDDLLNRLARWFNAKRLGWHTFWVREAYEAERSEHFHIVCNCPVSMRVDLEQSIRGWYRATANFLRVGPIKAGGISYRLKQMTAKAWGPPRPGRPRRETECRRKESPHYLSPVAPVLGARCGTSKSLSAEARAWWEAENPNPKGEIWKKETSPSPTVAIAQDVVDDIAMAA